MRSPLAADRAYWLRRGLDPPSRVAPTAQPRDARSGLAGANRRQAPLSARCGRSAGSPGRGPALRASPAYAGADLRGTHVERRRCEARSWPTARIGSAVGLTRRAGSGNTAQPRDARSGLAGANRRQAPLSARCGRSAGSPGRGPALRASPGYAGGTPPPPTRPPQKQSNAAFTAPRHSKDHA
jgi:hypothetical protein